MIYGANGYSGSLIAAQAVARGMSPVVAGRNAQEVEALAKDLGLPGRVFPIESVEQVAAQLDGCRLVLNCAGPFAGTAEILVQACIRRGIHYLDICGEPDIYERIYAMDAQAAAAGSVIVPGVGFDVVPSDTLARFLVDQLPDADNLELAFHGEGGGSAGSAKTVMGMMADKGRVRRNGKIQRVALAKWRKQVQFSDRELHCMSIPWGDVSASFRSNGVPNFTMYMAMPERAAKIMRMISPIAPLLAWKPIQQRMFAKIDQGPKGPTAEERGAGFMRLWGRACNAQGRCVEATMDTVQGFDFTAASALLCVEKLLAGEHESGCKTPTQAFGPEIGLEVPGTRLQQVEPAASD